MEFIKRLKEREPQYDVEFRELIKKYTLEQGGLAGTGTEKAKWAEGKYFSTIYEIYMYATVIGLKHDYKLAFPQGAKKDDFLPIKNWQPSEIADYIIMSLVAKSDIDLNGIEDLDDKAVEGEILKMRRLMEEYANGGFDKLRSKIEADPAFFENNENCFLDFLDET
jgi:hypothetical protein